MWILKHWIKFNFILAALAGCAPSSYEELRWEGEAETRKLAAELKALDTKEELAAALPRIKKRYNRIASILAEARKFRDRTADEPSLASEELFAELARLYEIPGGRELIETAQTEAISRLESSSRI